MNPGKYLQQTAGTAGFFNKVKGENYFFLFLYPIFFDGLAFVGVKIK